jgi:hypothetical protein
VDVGGYHILMQFDIDAERETVRQALGTEEGVRSWWSTRAEGPADGALRVSFPDMPQPFEFSVVEDGDRIDWVTGAFPPWWAGTTVRFELGENPDGPGTRVLFSHRDYDADNPVIPVVTPAWAQILLRLKGYAETGEPQPFFDL